MRIECDTCKEELDDRDVQGDSIICWKCGWKTSYVEEEDDEFDRDLYGLNYLEEWLIFH